MAFLDPFELLQEQVDDHITLSRFNYLNGQFPTDADGKARGFPDKKPISTLNLDNIEIPDYIKQYNDDEYMGLLIDEKIVLEDIEEDGDTPKYDTQLKFIHLVKSVFKFWYRSSDIILPILHRKLSKTKEEEFYEKFVSLVESATATEQEVRETLYDKDYWKNPSAYMALAKNRYGITTPELKVLPHFSFIDPKHTTSI